MGQKECTHNMVVIKKGGYFVGKNINNALIRIISERVNMSVGETKQMIVELAELIKEERGGG